ncbi:hypothetical protein AVEN_260366-1 [Araneus ventricosus]|uniref:Uncharacterized protein n=1 Tax=Araneus ventricosus TaxID=182803 RepID=A0A4Y2VUN5_ARAVE|nr:hypothetical protein AVEN_260366-1 [Araneus ventricosus]
MSTNIPLSLLTEQPVDLCQMSVRAKMFLFSHSRDGPGEEPAESCDGQGDDGHEASLPGGEGVRAAARPLHRHHEDAHREVREGLRDIPPTPSDS